MLKYKLKEKSIQPFSLSYLADYLKTLGIEQTESFIDKAKDSDEETFLHLDNIKETCAVLYESFKKNQKFFLQVDSDTDGYTSSAIFYLFFKELFPNARIEWRIHDGKEHGVIVDTVPIDADVIVIPDAGSMQFDEQEELARQGRTVVILDHHNIEQDYPRFENVYIVNNQVSQRFKNKNLSGAGVVYKTIQAFNYFYEDEFPMIYKKFTDLAALGIVADMMDTRDLDNNYIIQNGLKKIKNPMFKALLEKQAYSVSSTDNPNKIDLAFYIAPIINAVIRFGTTEEKEFLFKGFISDYENIIVETVYRGAQRKENFYDYVARTSSNVRGRQNREKEKNMQFLSERVDNDNLDEHQLLIVKISKDDKVVIPQTITGLVAMELLKKYKKPTLVLRPKSDGDGGTVYAGSGRGKINGDFDSLYGMLKESGLCEFVEGHDMAHGVGIKEENLPRVIEFANNYLKEIEFNVAEFEVDFIFRNSNINYEMIKQFGEATHLYGNGIPQPKFAFELKLAKSNIYFIGKNEDTLKIFAGGVEFIRFKSADIINKIKELDGDLFEFKFVGRAQINEWNNKITPQIVIDEIEFESIKIENLF